jgi:cell division protein FtsZ
MAKASFCGSPVKVKVIGLGGSGCNTVTRMVREDIRGVEFIAMNTDRQSLELTEAPVRHQLGRIITKGMGAGGDRELGRKAAEENSDEIAALVSDTDLVFITCGMGGGTGTGAAPVVAEIARKAGALTLAVVSKPFSFEGQHRSAVAKQGLEAMAGKVDAMVVVSNDRLLELQDRRLGIDEAFQVSDQLLKQGIEVIAEVLNTPGIINLDFADIKSILKNSGSAFMSIGTGRGPNRAIDAAQAALTGPLMDVSVAGAHSVLFNITGRDNLTLHEVNEAAEFIKRATTPEANIIFGVAHDTAIQPNEVKITLIATGFTVLDQIYGEDIIPCAIVKQPAIGDSKSEPPVITTLLMSQPLPANPDNGIPQATLRE